MDYINPLIGRPYVVEFVIEDETHNSFQLKLGIENIDGLTNANLNLYEYNGSSYVYVDTPTFSLTDTFEMSGVYYYEGTFTELKETTNYKVELGVDYTNEPPNDPTYNHHLATTYGETTEPPQLLYWKDPTEFTFYLVGILFPFLIGMNIGLFGRNNRKGKRSRNKNNNTNNGDKKEEVVV